MKRAAAIIGPTPSFVRWALRYNCDFRQLDCDNLPYDTFRQLRSIRELSNCRTQSRIIDGYCIHPEFNRDPKSARGFPASEIFDLFGSEQTIENNCGGSKANCTANDDRETWAGCFGWFFSQRTKGNWIEKFEEAAECDLSALPEASRIWFRVWQIREWNELRLVQLLGLLDQILGDPCDDNEMLQFHAAVKTSLDHGIPLETELVPRGNSDGVSWTTEPRCSKCSCEMEPDSRSCDECGERGSPLPAQKKKVLGLRPYMLLKDLVGEAATLALIEKFHLSDRLDLTSG